MAPKRKARVVTNSSSTRSSKRRRIITEREKEEINNTRLNVLVEALDSRETYSSPDDLNVPVEGLQVHQDDEQIIRSDDENNQVGEEESSKEKDVEDQQQEDVEDLQADHVVEQQEEYIQEERRSKNRHDSSVQESSSVSHTPSESPSSSTLVTDVKVIKFSDYDLKTSLDIYRNLNGDVVIRSSLENSFSDFRKVLKEKKITSV